MAAAEIPLGDVTWDVTQNLIETLSRERLSDIPSRTQSAAAR